MFSLNHIKWKIVFYNRKQKHLIEMRGNLKLILVNMFSKTVSCLVITLSFTFRKHDLMSIQVIMMGLGAVVRLVAISLIILPQYNSYIFVYNDIIIKYLWFWDSCAAEATKSKEPLSKFVSYLKCKQILVIHVGASVMSCTPSTKRVWCNRYPHSVAIERFLFNRPQYPVR